MMYQPVDKIDLGDIFTLHMRLGKHYISIHVI